MPRPERTLVTIPISHFCEKARWALDRAELAYTERRHIQIVHQLAARRAGGARTVPVLVTPDGVLTQSGDILRYADAQLPEERRLYPAATALRGEVLALEQRFDAVLGVEGRRFLAGDRFSAADLAFAALSAPLVVPPQYGTPLPQPGEMPERMAGPVRAWREHPSGRFALRMFAEQR